MDLSQTAIHGVASGDAFCFLSSAYFDYNRRL